MKFDASHQVNVKQSLTAAAISHAAGVFHICEAIFHIEDISLVPKERISLKKAFATANAFFMVHLTLSNPNLMPTFQGRQRLWFRFRL